MKNFSIFAGFAALLFLSSCKKETITAEADGKATIQFDARMGSADFALNQPLSAGGRTYEFSNFRYWVSKLILVKADNSEYEVPESYYLLEETNPVQVQDGSYTYPARKRESVEVNNIPMGDYKAIKFSIGVDAAYNDNLSLQAGELSQLSGMTNVSWMWHTSYIFTALHGKVTEGASSKNFIAETGLNSNYKSVSIEFPSAIRISSKANTAIGLTVDVAKLIDGIDLMANPTIGASQATLMAQMASNFATTAVAVSEAK